MGTSSPLARKENPAYAAGVSIREPITRLILRRPEGSSLTGSGPHAMVSAAAAGVISRNRRRAPYLYQSVRPSQSSFSAAMRPAPFKTVLTVVLACCLLAPARAGSCADGVVDEALVARTLATFGGRPVDGVFDYLDRLRPAPVSIGDKPALLRDVPLVTAGTRVNDPEKLERLRRVVRPALALHRRAEVIEIVIFRHDHPVALNRAGVVVAVSTTFLKVAGGGEAALVGAISHEAAHEYVAAEMLKAMRAEDLSRVRELELFCDAVAVATLVALDLNPRGYADLLGRLTRFSPEAARLNAGEHGMPSLGTRLKLIEEFGARLAGGSRP